MNRPLEGAVEHAVGAGERAGGGLYKYYVLAILLLVYIVNFIDRTILSIVAQPMKEDLGLADWQLGLLSGLAFAAFYVVMGIPVARLAERHSRVRIISILIVVWSIMTALCGLAQNFVQILLARFGVGVGEGGCSPASQSIIADYFPREKRATAMSIYSMGIPGGALFGALLGGWIAQEFGWRSAFMLVGLPGIALALLMFTIKEPIRGRYDPPAADQAHPGFATVLRRLWRKPTFVHIAAGAALATFANYGISSFAVPYLLRGFDISLVQASSAYGLITGLAAVLGTAMGGWLVDRFGMRDPRWYALIPATGVALSAPLYMLTFAQTSLLGLALLVILPAIIHYLYLGPTFGMTSNMVEARMRATASAILLLIMNLFGLGLGPTVVGALSDVFANNAYLGDYLASCPGGIAPQGSSASAMAACKAASFIGVKHGMYVAAAFYLWAGLHYFLAARSVRADLDHD